MNRKKQIKEYESKQLIDELSKMPSSVIAIAYLHAINYVRYGEDVTERWVTAIQNSRALEKAYREGYYDALQRQRESEELMEFSYHPIKPFDTGLSKEDRALINGMRNTAYVCGYRGEDIEFAVHQTLKRMGRTDLIPPCERVESENEE